MQKDYRNWMSVKAKIHNRGILPTYKEGKVYWLSVGENIGCEQDGKGELFTRPVLIIKGFSRNLFWGIPLTSQKKTGSYFYKICSSIDGKTSTALLLQMRAFDVSRLSNNAKSIGKISKKELHYIRKIICSLLGIL